MEAWEQVERWSSKSGVDGGQEELVVVRAVRWSEERNGTGGESVEEVK